MKKLNYEKLLFVFEVAMGVEPILTEINQRY